MCVCMIEKCASKSDKPSDFNVFFKADNLQQIIGLLSFAIYLIINVIIITT